jgi:hypothetical protein
VSAYVVSVDDHETRAIPADGAVVAVPDQYDGDFLEFVDTNPSLAEVEAWVAERRADAALDDIAAAHKIEPARLRALRDAPRDVDGWPIEPLTEAEHWAVQDLDTSDQPCSYDEGGWCATHSRELHFRGEGGDE